MSPSSSASDEDSDSTDKERNEYCIENTTPSKKYKRHRHKRRKQDIEVDAGSTRRYKRKPRSLVDITPKKYNKKRTSIDNSDSNTENCPSALELSLVSSSIAIRSQREIVRNEQYFAFQESELDVELHSQGDLSSCNLEENGSDSNSLSGDSSVQSVIEDYDVPENTPEQSSEEDILSYSSDSSTDEEPAHRAEPEGSLFEQELYNGSKLSVGSSCIVIMQFSRKFKLPRCGESDLLQLISLHCPSNVENYLPRNRSELLKKLNPLKNATKYKICDVCSTSMLATDLVCNEGHAQNTGQQNGTYFQHIPLEPQLQKLVKGE